MGCLLDVTVVDNNCVTVTSFRSCACGDAITSATNAATSKTSFIDLSISGNDFPLHCSQFRQSLMPGYVTSR
jgi:hypothetical protein